MACLSVHIRILRVFTFSVQTLTVNTVTLISCGKILIKREIKLITSCEMNIILRYWNTNTHLVRFLHFEVWTVSRTDLKFLLSFILWEEKKRRENTKINVSRRMEKFGLGKGEGKELFHAFFLAPLATLFYSTRFRSYQISSPESSVRLIMGEETECNLTVSARASRMTEIVIIRLGLSNFRRDKKRS